mgnify:CR=1 FL=1
MKKHFLLGLLPVFLLFGCGQKDDSRIGYGTDSVSNIDELKKGAVVDLTLDNWETYITVYYVRDNSNGTRVDTVVETWNFIGSSLCKFYNAELTYKTSYSESTSTKVLKLSISGCGQIASKSNYDANYRGTTAITGKVEVLF